MKASWLIPLGQTIFKVYAGRKLLQQGTRLSIDASHTYVEGVRAARLIACFVVALALATALAVAASLLAYHSIYEWYNNTQAQSGWLFGEFIVSIVFLGFLGFGIYTLLSERMWIRMFRIDELVARVTETQH